MNVTVAHRMSAEEYLALTLDPDSGRSELIEGEVVVNSPLLRHQEAVLRLAYALRSWVDARPAQRGRVALNLDVQLDDGNVFEPDVMVHPPGTVLDPDVRPYPLPMIAIEVRSPSTWRFDVGIKKRKYEEGGLPELWLVDTDAGVVLVFRRSRAGSTTFDVALEFATGDCLTSPLLPGFSLPVEELFG